MRFTFAGRFPGAAVTLPVLAALIAALLAACGSRPAATEPPEPGREPDASVWAGPPYAALCDMEILAIEAADPAEENRLNDALMALDVPLYITAALYEPAAKVAYDADEAGPREEWFRWELMARYFRHFAPEEAGRVEFGARLTVSSGAVEDCWNAWLRREAGEPLPPIPDAMGDTAALSGGLYSLEPTEGIYPRVSLIFAYSDTDAEGRGILTVYADVAREGAGEPYTVEITLLRRPGGGYVLLRAGSADPEEDVYVLYELTAYRAAVYLPADCVLAEESQQGASFVSPTGLRVEVYEEPFRGNLNDRRASDLAEGGAPLFDFWDGNRLEYGIIRDSGAGLRYRLVRQMDVNAFVWIEVSVPYDWVWDYFSLAESVFGSFGAADFPVDVVVGLEEYVMERME